MEKRAENVVGIQKETSYFVSEICTSFSFTFEKGCTAWSWDVTIWNPELAPVWMCNNYDFLWTTQVTHKHTHTHTHIPMHVAMHCWIYRNVTIRTPAEGLSPNIPWRWRRSAVSKRRHVFPQTARTIDTKKGASQVPSESSKRRSDPLSLWNVDSLYISR